MPDTYVIALTTLPAAGDDLAGRIARTLVNERLAACVSILPAMRSVYRWQGKVQSDDEQQLVIKTGRDCVEPLWRRLSELHPYEVPEFLVLGIEDGNPAYLDWIRGSVSPGPA